MSVPCASASSTFSVFSFSVTAATKRSWMPAVTMSRDDAVQRWPVEKYAPCTATLTAVGKVGVVEHDQRILAAHLELQLRHPRDRLRGDRAAGRRPIR